MSTISGKNRSILAGLVADGPVTETPKPSPREPVGPDRLSTRLSGLARVTSGDIREKTLQLVDPARCRMWDRHNRRYELLSEASCEDLLESLRAQGEQEFPAIVRRIANDPDFDFEVICGARRHWSVSYLRRVEHRDIKFLIEERDLSDEAAFRLSDLENRSRKDISDYERALDYQQAVTTYYGGIARRMAERLEVREAWLSRFLDLAKLPDPVVQAFGDVRQLRENHTRVLKPLLYDPAHRDRVLTEAQRLVGVQTQRRALGQPALEAAKVIASLRAATQADTGFVPGRASSSVVSAPSGAPLFRIIPKAGNKAILELVLGSPATNADFQAAFERAIHELRPQE